MEQLSLTIEELLAIGFKKHTYPSDELNAARDIYSISCLNGMFYYNPNERIEYKWYQRVIFGEASNFINLDIKDKNTLYTVLSAFKVAFRNESKLTVS